MLSKDLSRPPFTHYLYPPPPDAPKVAAEAVFDKLKGSKTMCVVSTLECHIVDGAV